MTAARDISVVQGATYREVWTWLSGDPAAAVDVTGGAAKMHVRDDAGRKVAGDEAVTLGGTAGTMTPAFATDTIPPGDYRYDLRLSLAEVVYVLARGKFTVLDRRTV